MKKIKIIHKNNELILKSQQEFRSEKYNILIREGNSNALSANDIERAQSIDSVKTYWYKMRKNLLCKSEEIKCNNIIKQYKIRNFDDVKN